MKHAYLVLRTQMRIPERRDFTMPGMAQTFPGQGPTRQQRPSVQAIADLAAFRGRGSARPRHSILCRCRRFGEDPLRAHPAPASPQATPNACSGPVVTHKWHISALTEHSASCCAEFQLLAGGVPAGVAAKQDYFWC